jgi:nicotinamide riboside transporter PnuC
MAKRNELFIELSARGPLWLAIAILTVTSSVGIAWIFQALLPVLPFWAAFIFALPFVAAIIARF